MGAGDWADPGDGAEMTNRLLEQTLRPMPVPDLMRERIEAQVREGQIALYQAGLTDRYGRWIWVPSSTSTAG